MILARRYIAVAATRGMIKLSSASVSPNLIAKDSAKIPKNEPTKAERGSMKIKQNKKATTNPQIDPNKLLYFLNGLRLYLDPKQLAKQDTESPKVKIAIEARAMFLLKMYITNVDPTIKSNNPLRGNFFSSSFEKISIAFILNFIWRRVRKTTIKDKTNKILMKIPHSRNLNPRIMAIPNKM